MPRQTSVQLTPATERQVEDLQEWGYGTFTDIVRVAVDFFWHRHMTLRDNPWRTLDAQILAEQDKAANSKK